MSQATKKAPIFWFDRGILVLPAQRSLGSALEQVRRASAVWLVVRRPVAFQAEPLFYAFRDTTLKEVAEEHPDRLTRRLTDALELGDDNASETSRGRRPDDAEPVDASERPSPKTLHVHLDAEGRPVAVGVRTVMHFLAEPAAPVGGAEGGGRGSGLGRGQRAKPPTTETPSGAGPGEEMEVIDLGEMRGGRRRSRGTRAMPPRGHETAAAPPGGGTLSADEPNRVDAILSAEGPSEIGKGRTEIIDVRLELAGETAAPLAHRTEAKIATQEKIRVILSVDSGALQIVGARNVEVDPPTAGKPALHVFEVRGADVGVGRVAVIFRQGGSELGTVSFSISVVADEPETTKVAGRSVAAPRDAADDDILVLLIDEEKSGTKLHYHYQLQSEALGFNYLEFRSAPLLDGGRGAAKTSLAYVTSLYKRLTKPIANRSDADRFAREVAAIGGDMCRQLFEPEFARLLWKYRAQLDTIHVTSWEPYIPWELVRLVNPDTDEADDKFLCEYSLVRSLKGLAKPRTLKLRDWSYLVATYPNNSHPPVGREIEYFTQTLPGKGVTPVAIPAEYDALFDALGAPTFDVLHIACHGESPHEDIAGSELIIGDEAGAGGEPTLVTVDPTTVRSEAKLKERQPLVFLNACESGRLGAGLTAWGGWPRTFLDAGAGAFVGTSWPVREGPAAKFSASFYDALLAGETLADAAKRAREATKAMGDGSWLAFKVYGHPRALKEAAS